MKGRCRRGAGKDLTYIQRRRQGRGKLVYITEHDNGRAKEKSSALDLVCNASGDGRISHGCSRRSRPCSLPRLLREWRSESSGFLLSHRPEGAGRGRGEPHLPKPRRSIQTLLPILFHLVLVVPMTARLTAASLRLSRSRPILSVSRSTLRQMSSSTSNTPLEDAIRSKLTAELNPVKLEINNDSHLHAHHAAMRDNTSPETHFRSARLSFALRRGQIC